MVLRTLTHTAAGEGGGGGVSGCAPEQNCAAWTCVSFSSSHAQGRREAGLRAFPPGARGDLGETEALSWVFQRDGTKTFPFRMSACRGMTLLLSTDDALDILCQMVFPREICFEWRLMSEAPYLAWLLTWKDTLRLSPLEGCFGEGWT